MVFDSSFCVSHVIFFALSSYIVLGLRPRVVFRRLSRFNVVGFGKGFFR